MIPVVTIDGPSGSGKGTVASLLAQRLGWHFLDSGALYRILGLLAERGGIAVDQPRALAELARRMRVEFEGDRVRVDGEDVSTAIRTEQAAGAASRVAAVPEVREALRDWQRDCARPPGLVADGRDMGTVVFPDAGLKIFLTASAEERARRRHNQLKEKGLDVSLPSLVAEIRERDQRDWTRAVAPLRPPEGALEVDTTTLSIEDVLDRVGEAAKRAFPDLVYRGSAE